MKTHHIYVGAVYTAAKKHNAPEHLVVNHHKTMCTCGWIHGARQLLKKKKKRVRVLASAFGATSTRKGGNKVTGAPKASLTFLKNARQLVRRSRKVLQYQLLRFSYRINV